MTATPAGLLLAPLELFLRTVPDRVHVGALAFAVDRTLRAQQQNADLEPLEGRSLRLEVSDTGNHWNFRVTDSHLRAADPADAADVTIRGRLADFVTLATRSEDPDTLFFQRRLTIEGDTEAGLMVKYLLDGFEFDWEAQAGAVLGVRGAARLRGLGERIGLDRGCARAAEHVRTAIAEAARRAAG